MQQLLHENIFELKVEKYMKMLIALLNFQIHD